MRILKLIAVLLLVTFLVGCAGKGRKASSVMEQGGNPGTVQPGDQLSDREDAAHVRDDTVPPTQESEQETTASVPGVPAPPVSVPPPVEESPPLTGDCQPLVEAPAGAAAVVILREPDCRVVTPAGWQQPLLVPPGTVNLTFAFGQAMDQPQVEAAVRDGTRHLPRHMSPNGPTVEVPEAGRVTVTWENDRRLRLDLETGDGHYFRISVRGLKTATGQETSGPDLDILVTSIPVSWLAVDESLQLQPARPVGTLPDIFWRGDRFFDGTMSADGKIVLMQQLMVTGHALDARPWLYFTEQNRLVPLPDIYYTGSTYAAALLPAGQGVVVVNHRTVYRYDPTGTRQVVWESPTLIHGMAVAPQSGRLALFVHGAQDDIHLMVMDPQAGAGTLADYGVVDYNKLPQADSVSRHKRISAAWSPDESEIAFGGGEYGLHPISYRFRLAQREPLRPIDGLQVQQWSADGRYLLYTTGLRTGRESTRRDTVVQSVTGAEEMRLDGEGWHLATHNGAPILWHEAPVGVQTLDGTAASTQDVGWALGWANGQLLVAEVPVTQP